MRYDRQTRFAPFGNDGQASLSRASATIVGCGALGSAAADMLARAGIGRLRLVDRDLVELGNLHRQSLYDESDVENGWPKAVALAAHLRRCRSDLVVDEEVADLDGANATRLLHGADVVLDGTDNFEARHVLNEACLAEGVPWVHAACLGASAVAWPIVPGRGACFACLVPEVPAPGDSGTCENEGVLGAAVHAAAAVQVAETMKLLAGRLDDLLPGPWSCDLWRGTSSRVSAVADPECSTCGARRWRFLGTARAGEAVACGRSAVQLRPAALSGGGRGADLEAIAAALGPGLSVRRNAFLLRFPAESHDVTVFRDGRVLVSGTRDVARARTLVARYLGG